MASPRLLRPLLLTALLAAQLGACGAWPWVKTAPTAPPTSIPDANATATPLPRGPVNPLSGLEVAEPDLLKMPAVLISISHFPATARPQAGLSFAPFAYEFYITEGATRFLVGFHGEWPAPEVAVLAGCQPRWGPFTASYHTLGNRAWFDEDADGVQDPDEGGVAGLCVKLLDVNGKPIAETVTDTNGYYGFDVQPGEYGIGFVRPDYFRFVPANIGGDETDSDVDPALGVARVRVDGDDRSIDVGLALSNAPGADANAATNMPLAQVGPIRSGRLIYRHLSRTFQESCLIYASASSEVLERLPQCAVVFHQIQGGGFMLDLEELWRVARKNQREARGEIDYGSYLFSEDPVESESPARELRLYFSYQNQSGWYYDEASQSYLRYVDTSVLEEAGILHPETDRLTGRQLKVENIIVMFAKHDVISPTNLDIRLDGGKSGKAVLFRDGQSLNIDWINPKDDEAGAGRPIQFLQKNGEPAPLRPGHTWVVIVTPDSTLQQVADGSWRLNFMPPEGAK